MAQFPQLPLFTDAILGDTQHLTTLEFGAYMLTLIIAWRTDGCCLPDDEIYLSRITRTGRGWGRVKDAVMAFWTLGEDGKHRQKRLTSEHLRVAEYVAQKSEAGKSSALKRKETRATGVAAALAGRGNGSSTPTPIPIPTPTKVKKEPAAHAPELLEFWRIFGPICHPGDCPSAAAKAHAKALSSASAEAINAGAGRYVARRKREATDRQFTMGAARWLNERRWEGEPTPPRPGSFSADGYSSVAIV